MPLQSNLHVPPTLKPGATPYEILQVRDDASNEVIKGAYKFLTQKWHPDKNPHTLRDAEEFSKALNEAYSILMDPYRRRLLDESLRRKGSPKPTAAEQPAAAKAKSQEPPKATVTPQRHPSAWRVGLFWAAVAACLAGLVFVHQQGLIEDEDRQLWILLCGAGYIFLSYMYGLLLYEGGLRAYLNAKERERAEEKLRLKKEMEKTARPRRQALLGGTATGVVAFLPAWLALARTGMSTVESLFVAMAVAVVVGLAAWVIAVIILAPIHWMKQKRR